MRLGIGFRITQLRNGLVDITEFIRLYITQNGDLYQTSDQMYYRVKN
jgi:hypothetical protein